MDESLVQILLDHQIDRNDLIQLGQSAQDRGLSQRQERIWQLVENEISQSVSLLAPIDSIGGWERIDGTIPWSKEDQANRFQQGPKWGNNSCALDSVLMAGLFLNIGRI